MTIAAPRQLTLAERLLALADCVCEQLAITGAGPTCWCGLFPGLEVSWDFCTDCANDVCGMGWVRVNGANPYDVFPTATVDLHCAMPLAVELEVGAIRCMPLTTDGALPTPEQLGDVTLHQLMDALALRTAIQCCGVADIALGLYTPTGPEGGCVGGFWSAFLAVD